MTAAHRQGQRAAGQVETAGWQRTSELMEEDGEGAAAGNQQRFIPTQNQGEPKGEFWARSLRAICCCVPVAAVWFVCQLEALPHRSLPPEDACSRLLLLCLLWASLAGSIYALRCCLRPGRSRVEPPQRKQQVVEPQTCRRLYSRTAPTRTPEQELPLTRALTDCLLLCVLQEPLQEPAVSHVEALHARLEAVGATLEEVDFGPEATDRLKLLCAYLEQRMGSLRALVRVQADFESSVEELLRGLDGLWAQLEELHTGVTLTKQDGLANRDLASVQADAENLVSVLGRYQNKRRSCQSHLKESTQLLQELTWSHAHISSKVNGTSESAWPELLLQSNIEQFDKVQESFSSLEQQTSTFKTHLQGLGKDHQEASGSGSRPDSPHNPAHFPDLPLRSSTPLGTKANSPLSLRERSALKFSSTMDCLRKPGKKK